VYQAYIPSSVTGHKPLFRGLQAAPRGFEFTIPCCKTADDSGHSAIVAIRPTTGRFSLSKSGRAQIPLKVGDAHCNSHVGIYSHEGFELIGGGGRPYPIRSGATMLAPNAASEAEIGAQDEDPVAAP
jgi:hypothetical protein